MVEVNASVGDGDAAAGGPADAVLPVTGIPTGAGVTGREQFTLKRAMPRDRAVILFMLCFYREQSYIKNGYFSIGKGPTRPRLRYDELHSYLTIQDAWRGKTGGS